MYVCIYYVLCIMYVCMYVCIYYVYMYVSDISVLGLPFAVHTCSDCIESRDPYCVWSTESGGRCVPSSLTALAAGVGAVPGQYVFLL